MEGYGNDNPEQISGHSTAIWMRHYPYRLKLIPPCKCTPSNKKKRADVWNISIEISKVSKTGRYSSNLESPCFDINDKVGAVATDVGKTPMGWNGDVFAFIKSITIHHYSHIFIVG